MDDYNEEYLGPVAVENTGYILSNPIISDGPMSSDKLSGECIFDYSFIKNANHNPTTPQSGTGQRNYKFELLHGDPAVCNWDFKTESTWDDKYYQSVIGGGETAYVAPPSGEGFVESDPQGEVLGAATQQEGGAFGECSEDSQCSDDEVCDNGSCIPEAPEESGILDTDDQAYEEWITECNAVGWSTPECQLDSLPGQ